VRDELLSKLKQERAQVASLAQQLELMEGGLSYQQMIVAWAQRDDAAALAGVDISGVNGGSGGGGGGGGGGSSSGGGFSGGGAVDRRLQQRATSAPRSRRSSIRRSSMRRGSAMSMSTSVTHHSNGNGNATQAQAHAQAHFHLMAGRDSLMGHLKAVGGGNGIGIDSIGGSGGSGGIGVLSGGGNSKMSRSVKRASEMGQKMAYERMARQKHSTVMRNVRRYANGDAWQTTKQVMLAQAGIATNHGVGVGGGVSGGGGGGGGVGGSVGGGGDGRHSLGPADYDALPPPIGAGGVGNNIGVERGRRASLAVADGTGYTGHAGHGHGERDQRSRSGNRRSGGSRGGVRSRSMKARSRRNERRGERPRRSRREHSGGADDSRRSAVPAVSRPRKTPSSLGQSPW
jgi:hypothetical protein